MSKGRVRLEDGVSNVEMITLRQEQDQMIRLEEERATREMLIALNLSSSEVLKDG